MAYEGVKFALYRLELDSGHLGVYSDPQMVKSDHNEQKFMNKSQMIYLNVNNYKIPDNSNRLFISEITNFWKTCWSKWTNIPNALSDTKKIVYNNILGKVNENYVYGMAKVNPNNEKP